MSSFDGTENDPFLQNLGLSSTRKTSEPLPTQVPTDQRERAKLREKVWKTYSPETQHAIYQNHHSRRYIEEYPTLNTTADFLSDSVLRAENAGRDVSACWDAFRQGLPAATLARQFRQAKRRHRANPRLDFGRMLAAALKTPLARHRKRLSRRPPVEAPIESIPSVTSDPIADAADWKESEVKVTVVRSVADSSEQLHHGTIMSRLHLGEKYDRLLEMALTFGRITEEEFFRRLALQFFDNSGVVQQMQSALKDVLSALPKPKAESKAVQKPKAAATVRATPKSSVVSPAKATQPPAATEADKDPPLHERLRIVTGADEVTIPEAIERLAARGWLPESTDMKAYISLAFSTHPDTFERVRRGVYRVVAKARG